MAPCRMIAPLLLLVPLAQGLVCRPCLQGQECDAIKGEGEECGGFCGFKGKCAEGLICQEDEYLGVLQGLSTRVHTLLGGPPPPSHCVRSDSIKSFEQRILSEEAVKRQLGHKRVGASCPGCPQDGDPNSAEVQEAAEEAVALLVTHGELSEDATSSRPKLGRVVSVETQVVSGIKYHLVLKVLLGDTPSYWDVEIVSQPWLNPPYTLVSSKRIEDPNFD